MKLLLLPSSRTESVSNSEFWNSIGKISSHFALFSYTLVKNPAPKAPTLPVLSFVVSEIGALSADTFIFKESPEITAPSNVKKLSVKLFDSFLSASILCAIV